MSDVLSEADLRDRLTALTHWSGDTSEITRSVEAPGWLDGIWLVEEVAQAADGMDHHPDIDIRYKTVTFRLSTHTAGGVTARDLELAAAIDEVAERLGAS